MTPFAPTHEIAHGGETIPVQCEPIFDDGRDTGRLACYTEAEADFLDAADWEYRPETGELAFQGQAPTGSWEIVEVA